MGRCTTKCALAFVGFAALAVCTEAAALAQSPEQACEALSSVPEEVTDAAGCDDEQPAPQPDPEPQPSPQPDPSAEPAPGPSSAPSSGSTDPLPTPAPALPALDILAPAAPSISNPLPDVAPASSSVAPTSSPLTAFGTAPEPPAGTADSEAAESLLALLGFAASAYVLYGAARRTRVLIGGA